MGWIHDATARQASAKSLHSGHPRCRCAAPHGGEALGATRRRTEMDLCRASSESLAARQDERASAIASENSSAAEKPGKPAASSPTASWASSEAWGEGGRPLQARKPLRKTSKTSQRTPTGQKAFCTSMKANSRALPGEKDRRFFRMSRATCSRLLSRRRRNSPSRSAKKRRSRLPLPESESASLIPPRREVLAR